MTNHTIAIAGSNGALGSLVSKELAQLGIQTRLLVRRPSGRPLADFAQEHVVDYRNVEATARALEGTSCVVSTLAGLEEVVVDTQRDLLRAVEKAEVPRFIPSDYSIDYTKLSDGSNRNLDLRRVFRAEVDRSPVQSTSIFNGAFMDMLTGVMPMVQFRLGRILFWGDPDQRLDFTTIADTARFTARVALDPDAPRDLYVAGDSVSARDLSETMSELTGRRFGLLRPGGLGQLRFLIKVTRFFVPGRKVMYPPWQGMQYFHNMLNGAPKFDRLDNERYSGLVFDRCRDVLGRHVNPKATALAASVGS
ncbi:MAG: NmrA family NAD(P)-binding protein [Myxococcota bacterium]